MDKDAKIKELEEENTTLQLELQFTKEHLKKYTAPSSRKLYYENNKEQILEKKKLNPSSQEKRKEYNKISYLRRKEMDEIKKNENV